MNEPPEPSQDQRVNISAETAEEYDQIRAVTAKAFVHHPSVADLVELIRQSPQYIPELSLVAKDGDEVVGHIMLSHVDLVDGDGVRHRVVTLSPVSVAPTRQGQGIGSNLITTALQRADDLGESLVILEGSPAYYPRFGFRPAADFQIRITLPEWAPPEAAMVFPLAAYEPSIRGTLRYPPAFRATGSGL